MLTNNSNSKCGVLYIDDEEKALKYFRMAFSDKFLVFTAGSGKEGLEILRRESENIGIVISDQRMPEMLGAEILGIVREEFPRIVRILTTAYSDLDSAIQAVNQGHIYQYVVKPWEIPELGMVLQRAADYYHVLSERNELLALKMTTLQRIICSDRLKWLLLSSRYWDEPAQVALHSVLSTLVKALPDSLQSIAGNEKFSGQHFEISSLIRDEYQNALRCLEGVDQIRMGRSAEERTVNATERLNALSAALIGKYGLAADQIEVIASGADRHLRLSAASLPGHDFLRALFGVLLERKTSDLSLGLFEALFAMAVADGSLTISVESNGQTEAFNLVFPAPQNSPSSSDEAISHLAEKFERWDISKL